MPTGIYKRTLGLRKGKNNPMYGKKHTVEWKEKHKKDMTGFKHTEKSKKKMRKSKKLKNTWSNPPPSLW